MPAPSPILLPPVRLPLWTPRLALRLPRTKDAPTLAGWFRDRRVTRPIPLWSDYTLDDGRRFARLSAAKARRREGLQLVITRREDGQLIGGIGLVDFNPVRRSGHLGYWIARPHWGQGYAPEAASRLCALAFERVGLHRLETGVLPSNRRSAAVLRRLGFVEEGRARRAYRIGGRWVDSLYFGLLAEEFRPYVPDARRKR